MVKQLIEFVVGYGWERNRPPWCILLRKKQQTSAIDREIYFGTSMKNTRFNRR